MCTCRSPSPGHSSAGSLLRQESHAGGGWARADAGDSIWQGAAVPAIPPRAGECGLMNMAMRLVPDERGNARHAAQHLGQLHAADLWVPAHTVLHSLPLHRPQMTSPLLSFNPRTNGTGCLELSQLLCPHQPGLACTAECCCCPGCAC